MSKLNHHFLVFSLLNFAWYKFPTFLPDRSNGESCRCGLTIAYQPKMKVVNSVIEVEWI